MTKIIRDEKLLLSDKGNAIAIRAHSKDNTCGYYAVLTQSFSDEAEDMGMGAIGAALMRITSMSWQDYTHYTVAYIDPAKLAMHDNAKDGQIKLYWCEILGYRAFECKLTEEQIQNCRTRTRGMPEFILREKMYCC